MKKEQVKALVDVKLSELPSIVTSIDPVEGNRLPVGVEFAASEGLKWMPAQGRVKTPWAAIILTDKEENSYSVSPRTLLSVVFQNGKPVRPAELKTPFPAKKTLYDILKDGLKVRVVGYAKVEVDKYVEDRKDGDAYEQAVREMPIFELV